MMQRLFKESRERMKKAREGDTDALDKAQKSYLKTLALEREKVAIEGKKDTKERSMDILEELEKELAELEKRNK